MPSDPPTQAASKPSPASTTASVDRAELTRRASSGDPIAAVELVRQAEASMETESPLGYTKLCVGVPKRVIYPKVPRRLSRVDPALCGLFGKLAAGEAPWPLLVWGGVGGGKTFAGLCFADMIRGSIFLTLEQGCDGVMRGKRHWESKHPEHGDLLILDEIGERSKAGDLLYTTLKSILDYREYNHQRVGMYISNLSPAELAVLFDDRIVSRLTAGSVVKLVGPDRRMPSETGKETP